MSLENLFNSASLYTKESFKVFSLVNEQYELNEDEYNKFIAYIGLNSDKIVSLCHKCKKEFPFEVKKSFVRFNNTINYYGGIYITKAFQNSPGGNITGTGLLNGAMPPYPKDKLFDNKIWYLEYSLICTNNEEHNYIMIVSIELNDGTFIVKKVGQNPSMLTIKGFDFDKYKKQLEIINAYDDYKKADLSNADHFYVGAYAYLRRIFEKMVNKYLDGQQLKDNHMDTKINAIKDRFDPRVQKMLKNLYGILSVSIHELDEEDSKEYYVYLKAIIDIQLEYEKTEQDKENQSKELETVLNKIANGINTNGGEK